MERIIPRLKLFRWKRGLSQKKLAEMSDIPLWKIRAWEEGKRSPSIEEMIRIQYVLRGNFPVIDPNELSEVRKIRARQLKKKENDGN